jgi:hypothetical protein
VPVTAIDFEASCLPRHGRSYPIEVGIACAHFSHNWIIRPHDSWAGWDWTQEAQSLHGLTHDRILAQGLPVDVVLAQLTQAIGNNRVVADSLIDQYWLDTLAQAAGAPRPFRIDHVSLVIDESRAGEGAIRAAVDLADQRHPIRHRARDDARWLSAVVECLLAPSAPVAAAQPGCMMAGAD